jgi:LPS export ABC transporter protein LptC/lipopolysaccharide transport protein LptA
MKWQRILRLVLIFLAVATAIGVAMSLRKRDLSASKIPVKRLDPKAIAESAQGRLSQMTGMKIPGFLEFDRNLTYEDGSVKFLGARLTTRRAGREFHLSGNEARVGKEQSHMEVTGNVFLTASDGLKVRTDRATYGNTERIVRAPNLVKFAKGTLRGSGVGMTYDEQRDVLWLLKDVKIDVAPDKKTNDPGARIVSGTAGLARRDKYMRFDGGVSIVRSGRTIEAKSALAYLTDDGNSIKAMELRGGSRIAMTEPSPGGLQALGAPEMNLGFRPDGETIQRALLAGGGVIQMAGTGGKAGRRIAGRTIDVALGEQSEVTSLSAHDDVQLTIPADADTPERTIRSALMDATGEAGKGLTAATFNKNVEFREVRGPDAYREAHSSSLAVVLTDGGLDDAQFKGGTKFEDGKSTATAADARYLVSKGRLLLSGNVGPQPPQVQDERITVDAKAIDMGFEGPKLIATGEVRSVMKPAKKPVGATGLPTVAAPAAKVGARGATGAPGLPTVAAPAAKVGAKGSAKTEPKVPGMLKDDQPAYVTAPALDYDGENGKAIYTGGSRLWQGDTAVTGDTITIDESTGDLYANTNVRTSFILDQLDSKTQMKKRVPTIASSKDMHYEDALRRATYTTNAHVNGPQGDLRGVKIEMYMLEGASELDRVEAYDDVNLKTDVRTATGARMTYLAKTEEYHMKGEPVNVVEECRTTTCKSLTFWRSTDRILCDGSDEKRTLAKSKEGPCGGASPK